MATNKFKGGNGTINTSEMKAETPRGKKITIITEPSLDLYHTRLFNGNEMQKSDKLFSILGTIEELISYLAIIKTEHFDTNYENKFDIDSSAKLFMCARLTQIQENVMDIAGVIAEDKNRAEFGFGRTEELKAELELMSDTDFVNLKKSTKERFLKIIPGSSVIEARLFHARALVRRLERQMCLASVPHRECPPSGDRAYRGTDNACHAYVNTLGDYLLALSIHILHIQQKEPMIKTVAVSPSVLKIGKQQPQANLK